ncbi:MAG: hypothetical protein AAGF23_20290 [Acidobacteriota bacterium]
MSPPESPATRRQAAPPRPGFFWRLAAAVPVNYAYTSIVSVFLARHLPMAPAQASLTASMFSFLVFATVALTAFSVRSVLRLWAFLLSSGSVLALMAWISILEGGTV